MHQPLPAGCSYKKAEARYLEYKCQNSDKCSNDESNAQYREYIEDWLSMPHPPAGRQRYNEGKHDPRKY